MKAIEGCNSRQLMPVEHSEHIQQEAVEIIFGEAMSELA